MFSDTLSQLAELEVWSGKPVSRVLFDAASLTLLATLHEETSPLFAACEAILSIRFSDRETQFVRSAVPAKTQGDVDVPVVVGGMVIRSSSEQEAHSLEINLCRPYAARGKRHSPTIDVSLEVQSLSSRENFSRLYSDYRAQIQHLLTWGSLRFVGDPSSTNVVLRPKATTGEHIDRFLEDRTSPVWFSLTAVIDSRTPPATSVRSFLVVALLYTSLQRQRRPNARDQTLEQQLQRLG